MYADHDPSMKKALTLLTLLLVFLGSPELQARTVYRCVQKGTVSLATAPEPGSKCTAQTFDDLHHARLATAKLERDPSGGQGLGTSPPR